MYTIGFAAALYFHMGFSYKERCIHCLSGMESSLVSELLVI